MTDTTKLSDSARADLQARIEAAFRASVAARACNDRIAADQCWREFIGLLEVQMGRSSSAGKLTMTPSPVADITAPQGHRKP